MQPGDAGQRGEWIQARLRKRPAPVRRQRFGQNQQAIQPVHRGQRSRCVKRQAQVDASEHPTEHRTQHEADAEHRAQSAQGLCALLHRRDVGHVRLADREVGRQPTTEHAGRHDHPQ